MTGALLAQMRHCFSYYVQQTEYIYFKVIAYFFCTQFFYTAHLSVARIVYHYIETTEMADRFCNGFLYAGF